VCNLTDAPYSFPCSVRQGSPSFCFSLLSLCSTTRVSPALSWMFYQIKSSSRFPIALLSLFRIFQFFGCSCVLPRSFLPARWLYLIPPRAVGRMRAMHHLFFLSTSEQLASSYPLLFCCCFSPTYRELFPIFPLKNEFRDLDFIIPYGEVSKRLSPPPLLVGQG